MGDSRSVNPAVAGLKGLLDKQTALREVAEKRARRSRDALQRVAEALCSRALDRVRKEDADSLSAWDADKIADFIIREVRQQLDQIDLADVHKLNPLSERAEPRADSNILRNELGRAQPQTPEVERTLRQTEARAEAAEKETEALEQTVAAPQKGLSTPVDVPPKMTTNLTQPSTPTSDPLIVGTPQRHHSLQPGLEPRWMAQWREAETFEQEAALIIAMGETGECRRSRLVDLADDRTGLRSRGDGIKHIIPRLVKMGLVESIPVENVIKGRSIHHLKLTPQGRKAYLFLTRKEPVASVLDELLTRYKSPEQTYFHLEAADLLEEVGYTVDRYPPDISLSDGGRFAPDLAATSSAGEVLWVAIEHSTGQSQLARKTKWTHYYEASEGHFVIVTTDRLTMDAIGSEIAFWAGTRPLRVWMTNITDARGGDRGRDGSIWLYQRGGDRSVAD